MEVNQDNMREICKKQISEEDAPIIRMWPEEEGDTEFRFCRECSEKAGVHFALASKTMKP